MRLQGKTHVALSFADNKTELEAACQMGFSLILYLRLATFSGSSVRTHIRSARLSKNAILL